MNIRVGIEVKRESMRVEKSFVNKEELCKVDKRQKGNKLQEEK